MVFTTAIHNDVCSWISFLAMDRACTPLFLTLGQRRPYICGVARLLVPVLAGICRPGRIMRCIFLARFGNGRLNAAASDISERCYYLGANVSTHLQLDYLGLALFAYISPLR